MSEIDVLDVLNSMLETERAFLQAIRFLSSDRESLLAFHQRNTATTLTLLRMYMASNNNTTTFTIPITVPTGWNDPSDVRPTAAQISRATTTTSVPPTETNCSICQDSLMESGTRISHCGHVFHNNCIAEWFTRSVFCPMCRHDIRAVDHPAPTSSDPISTPPRVSNPLAEWMSAGYPIDRTEDTEESDEHRA